MAEQVTRSTGTASRTGQGIRRPHGQRGRLPRAPGSRRLARPAVRGHTSHTSFPDSLVRTAALVLAPPLALALAVALARRAPAPGQPVQGRVPTAVPGTPLTGRVYIFVTRHADTEPRLQVRHQSDRTPLFGVAGTASTPG